jgi:hypothetical protein
MAERARGAHVPAPTSRALADASGHRDRAIQERPAAAVSSWIRAIAWACSTVAG